MLQYLFPVPAANISAGPAGGTQATSVSSFRACSDMQRNQRGHWPTNDKQNPPSSLLMPEMVPVVVQAFLAPW
jgi:hypothetical protein